MAVLSLDGLCFTSAGVQEWGRKVACLICGHGRLRLTSLVSAQMAGLLCEEEVLEVDNVKYCGYCKYHFSKMDFQAGEHPSAEQSITEDMKSS
ncbi:hypothetical protein P7K49_011543 [Saguinus oedipus]|uniref:Uncharacterized protein n=1 Tax=Saguinus oedipus TaxID=9490 RepID=A0ABQ9VQX8_SAGOE|nr:hypothetical protein P7K49_011543 [Saguinus oedipus]